MSQQEAKAVIEKLIKDVLESESPRIKLDATFHVLDLSYAHVLKVNKLKDTQLAKESYIEFIQAVEFLTKKADSLDSAIAASRKNRNIGPQFISNISLLVCLNFGAARTKITEISHNIPNNEYFGISYRERTLEELKYAYKLEEDSSLVDMKDKTFLLDNGKVGTVQKVKIGKRTKFELTENTQLGPFTHVLVPIPTDDSVFKLEAIALHRGAQLAHTDGVVTLGSNKDPIQGPVGYFPKLKREWLSKLDLGHLFKKDTAGGRTPLGDRLQEAFKYEGLSVSARSMVQQYIDKLDKAHGKVTYVFHNQAPGSGDSKTVENVGIVVLSVQFFELNNELAVVEAKIKRSITEKFKKIAAKLPGSNTIVEDIVEKTRNKIVNALNGKVKVLKKHNSVNGSIPMRDKTLPKPTNTGIKGTNKNNNISSAKKTIKVVKEPANIGLTTVNLTSLQSLINQHLQNVISANMGDGSSKRILNYRTGRFAASAKVESMSQSRQGMITAFYSYMKNPYQTFEPGFKQGSPKTRDPKLLISQSIREIAAIRVGNQLRAQAL